MRLKRFLRFIRYNDVTRHFRGETANAETEPLMVETRERNSRFNQVLAAIVGKKK